ncbi:MAG TPA: GTP cyclohydrolase IIa [Nitrososphaera sp.]|nr:GTP cyclohydrolase IIa [Nitrososphaera sp.]
MIQLTIIRIEGYGPWTLTLGSDREAQLQMLQARIYHDVQRLFTERNCIVFFNRFDEYFAITNGLDAAAHKEIQSELAATYPDLKLSMAIGSGMTALAANLDAYKARKQHAPDGKAGVFGTSRDAGDAQIMHIDVESSTKVGDMLSPYEVTALVTKIYSKLVEEFLKLNSLTFFLGGDNFMVISNGVTRNQADAVIRKVTDGTDVKLNCGIGIGRTGRKTAEAATKALDTIRDLRREGKIQPIYEIRCP